MVGHKGSRQQEAGNRRGSHSRPPNQNRQESEMDELSSKIVLVRADSEPLAPELFDKVADRAAEIVAKEKTKTSQLRRFYDELVRWDEKINGRSEDARSRLRESLPFIRMMNAKAAYANGRRIEGRPLVGKSFVTMLRACLKQINDDPAALRNCRLFFEAFMGFYKLHGPQDSQG